MRLADQGYGWDFAALVSCSVLVVFVVSCLRCVTMKLSLSIGDILSANFTFPLTKETLIFLVICLIFSVDDHITTFVWTFHWAQLAICDASFKVFQLYNIRTPSFNIITLHFQLWHESFNNSWRSQCLYCQWFHTAGTSLKFLQITKYTRCTKRVFISCALHRLFKNI